MQRWIVLHGTVCIAALFFSGCEGGPDGSSSGDPGHAILPPGCLDTNPFLAEECGRSLKTLCRSQLSEHDCSAQRPFVFDSDVYYCGWARVVKFSDPHGCTVESVRGRCEAGFVPGIECGDACDGEPSSIYKGFRAIPSESELVEMPCIHGLALSGPVSEATALSNQQTGERYAHACGNVWPPPPALCDCESVACEAE